MSDPITTTAIVAGLIEVTDKLLDKIPDYGERKRKDYLELKLNFNNYKNRPIEQRVNSYLVNLLLELTEVQKDLVGQL